MQKRALHVLWIMFLPLWIVLSFVYMFSIILPMVDYIVRGEKALVVRFFEMDEYFW